MHDVSIQELLDLQRRAGRGLGNHTHSRVQTWQCAHRWVKRFRVEAESGLLDRSSRPHRTPSKTSTEREDAVIAARKESRCWPARLSRATGVPERTISRILARRGLPPLAVCEPVSGAIIRATRSTAIRYERQSPGELIQVDVKKLGRIPDGGAGGPMADRRRSAGEASDSTTSL